MTEQVIDFKKYTKAQLIQAMEENDKAFNEAAFRLAHVNMDIYNALELSVAAVLKDDKGREYFAIPKEAVEYVKNIAKETSAQFAAALGGHIEFQEQEPEDGETV